MNETKRNNIRASLAPVCSGSGDLTIVSAIGIAARALVEAVFLASDEICSTVSDANSSAQLRDARRSER